MEKNRSSRNLHLLWRSGFGPAATALDMLKDHSPARLYALIEQASLPEPVVLSAVTEEQPALPDAAATKSPEQKRMAAKKSAAELQELSLAWLDQMAASPAQLREKLALFWHGHFACRSNNSLYQEQLLAVIRKHAFGNFGSLLREVSKSAAMLRFLNNQQNRKKQPNENFAREVFELFTLGRGHYSEADIREAARAFTGWTHDTTGSFLFKEQVHDAGSKTVLGKTGPFNGDDVLDLILANPRTARFITERIYRHFVSETPDQEHIDQLSAVFLKSGYDIPALMRAIFTSDWFYDPAIMGTQIKSPVAYLTGIRRMLQLEISNAPVQLLLQRVLGQWLFYPPNVAGWPGGYAWIDNSSLMLRLRIPSLIRDEEAIGIRPKDNDDTAMGSKEVLPVNGKKPGVKSGGAYRIIASIDWLPLERLLAGSDPAGYYERLCPLLLQAVLPPGFQAAISPISGSPGQADYLQKLVIALMSTPEYQLC